VSEFSGMSYIVWVSFYRTLTWWRHPSQCWTIRPSNSYYPVNRKSRII